MTYRRNDRVHQFTTVERKDPDLFNQNYSMGGTVVIASLDRAYVKWDYGYPHPVWTPNKYLYPGEPPEGMLTGYENAVMLE